MMARELEGTAAPGFWSIAGALHAQGRAEEVGKLESIHLMIRDFNQGFIGLLSRQTAGIDVVGFEELNRRQRSRPLIPVPVGLVGTYVQRIGRRHLVEVPAAPRL